MKPDLKTPYNHSSLLPGPNFHPVSLPPPSPPSGAGGQVMEVMISSSHVSAIPSSSGGGLLTLCPCSSMRSLSRETVLHKRLQCESFPRAAALHKLPQCGSFPWGAVLQEQAAPAWVPHGVTSPASKPAPVWAPLSMGPQVLAGACSSVGSPWGHNLLQASTCSGVGSLPWATGGYLLHCGSPWTAGGQPDSPLSSSRAAREDSLLWCFEHLLPPPSSLILVSAELFLSHSLTPLSSRSFSCIFFLPLLKYVFPDVLPPLLIGLALGSGGSILQPASTDFIRHEGSFSQLLTEAIAPSLPKPCHANP